MNVLKGVVDMQIKNSNRIDDVQFVFTPWHGTTDSYHVHLGMIHHETAVGKISCKKTNKQKNLYLVLVDLQMAFDRFHVKCFGGL